MKVLQKPDESSTETTLNWNEYQPKPLAFNLTSNVSYKISYKLGAEAPIDCSSDNIIAPEAITGTSHTVTDLVDGDEYSFRVCVLDEEKKEITSIAKSVSLKSWQIEVTTSNPNEDFDLGYDDADGLVVDWGDDSRETITESGSDLSKTHSYLNAGVYTLKIRGKAKRINFFNTKAQDKVTRIISKVQGVKGIESFESSFRALTNLAGEIPEKLFDHSIKATDFSNTFNGASSLTGEIPEKLFEKNTLAADFSGTFRDTESLSGAIPADLFSNNTEATNFSYTFKGSSQLSGAIPEELFVNNDKAISFTSTFEGASSLEGPIPENLFASNLEATSFANTFKDASSINGIVPEKLFEKNINASNFFGAFKGASSLSGNPPTIWDSFPNAIITDIFANAGVSPNSVPAKAGGQSALPYSVSYTDGSGVNESGTEATISWVSAGGTTASFKVDYQAGPTAPADCIAGSPATSPYSIAGLTADDTYSYRICAIDVNGAEIAGANGTVVMASTKFVFNTQAPGADKTVKLKLKNYDVVIDWGDGPMETLADSSGSEMQIEHTYVSDGEYTMAIRGSTELLNFQDEADVDNTSDDSAPTSYMGEPALISMSSDFQGLKDVISLKFLLKAAANLEMDLTSRENLFANLSELESLNSTFASDNSPFDAIPKITGTIPKGFLSKNTELNNLNSLFYNAAGITGTIPSDLFANNPDVTSMRTVFYLCSGLTGSIPENLFANNPLVETFQSTFYGNSSLTGSIPENLFANNPLVKTFQSTFNGNSSLTGSIPENLFANNPLVTSFYVTFYRASGLTGSIPENLFANNPLVDSFRSTFNGASGLTGSIPVGLFANNPAVESFRWAFSGAPGLNGTAADIWTNAATDFPNLTDTTYTFTGASGLTNRASIPQSWGGDACADLPGDWVLIPGDADYGTTDFCVMKYEAKDDSGTASSVPAGVPWASISQDDAKTKCEDLGTGYGLMTNGQWMSIASNIAAVGDNWDGGTVGTNRINGGHNDDAPSGAQAVSDPADPCSDTGETCDASTWNSQRRTHKLSNNEIIWDISANLWEWTDLYISDANTTGPTTGGSNEYTDVTGGTSMTKIELIPQIAIDNAWDSFNGIGTYRAATGADKGALARGGFFNEAFSGIFDATLDRRPDTGGGQVGFRCTYSP